MSSDVELPDWLARVAGEAALLLVAPHGGRRARASALELDDPRKVNDLHTAELTFELAARLRARAIVNRSEDRNRLDLNRVSDVRDRACLIIDDMISTGGTINESIKALLEAGARPQISIAATHGLFIGDHSVS